MRRWAVTDRNDEPAIGDIMRSAQINALAITLESLPSQTAVHCKLRGTVRVDGAGLMDMRLQIQPQGAPCTGLTLARNTPPNR